MSRRGILKASIIQMAFNAAAVGLAFVREMLLANYFGATEATDAYLVAYALPFMLHTVIITVLPLVLVPELEHEGPRSEGGKRLLSGALTVQIVVLGALGVAIWFAAPAIIALQAPGLAGGTAFQATALFRIMLPIIIILPLTWTLCSLLFALKNFALPAAGKVLFALVGVLALALFAERAGVEVAATGVLIAAAAQLALMVPVLLRHRLSPFSPQAARSPATRHALVATLVMVPVQANLYIYLIVDRFLASSLPAGTISILNYGDKVVRAFAGITSAALGLVIFSYLAEAAAAGDHTRLDSMAAFAIRLVAIILLPLQVGAIVLGEPLVRLLFERGAFSASDTAFTAVATNLQMASLFATGLSLVLYRVLFALQKYRTALAASSAIVVVNIALKAGLVGVIGYRAMPLATSISAVAEAVLIGWLLLDRLPSLRTRALWGEVGKVAVAAIIMGACVAWGRVLLAEIGPFGQTALVQVVGLGLIGGLLYLGLLQALRVGGVDSLWSAVGAYMGRRRPAEDGGVT